MGAFLGDRNIRVQDVGQLHKVIEKVCEFDRKAVHRTNVAGKSAVFTTNVRDREQVKHIQIDGEKPKTVLTETMVGHTVATRRLKGQVTSRLNARAEELIKRAAKIGRSDLPTRQRRLLVEAAAVPVFWCGSQWHLPRADLQVKAANTVVTALWGPRRKLRSREIVLGTLHDPTRVDPVSSIIYKRFSDARRAMLRSEDRHNYAIHVNALLEDDSEHPSVGPPMGCDGPQRRWVRS